MERKIGGVRRKRAGEGGRDEEDGREGGMRTNRGTQV